MATDNNILWNCRHSLQQWWWNVAELQEKLHFPIIGWFVRVLWHFQHNLGYNVPYKNNKKLSYRRVTARCVLSVVILPIATQQCRNYLYDKSWPNRWYEVGGLVSGNVSWTMCTQPWRDRVGWHCLRCHKQTDDGRVVYITCIPTTCCGEIFQVHNVEIAHVTLTTPTLGALTHHKTKTSHGRPVYKIWSL